MTASRPCPKREQHARCGYYVALEVKQTFDGLTIAVPQKEWSQFATLTPAQLTQVLHRIAKGVALERYRKHRRGPKKPITRKKVNRGAHIATARLLQTDAHTP